MPFEMLSIYVVLKKYFMKKVLSLVAIAFSMFLLSSCDKDKTNPENENVLGITILETSVPKESAEVCGTMQDNVLKLTTGVPLVLKMQLKGNRNLSQYKIDIHANFDCHGHERPLSEWHYLKVENISGKDVTVTETIPLPLEAFTGNYHCIIRLIDEEGNEAPFTEFSLIVNNAEDSEAPVITYQQPASDSIAASRGDVITFQGNVSDNLSLQNGRLEITYVDANGSDYTAIMEQFSSQEHSVHPFNRTYELPSFVATGVANFTLKAYDKFNNFSEQKIKINVLP